MRKRVVRISAHLAALVILGLGCAADRAAAQEGTTRERIAPPIDPSQLGLALPTVGKAEPGAGRRVVTLDESGQPVVAKLHVQLGDSCVMMLPSGRLTSGPAAAAVPTERPFEPLAGDELVRRMQTGPLQDFKIGASDHYAFLYKCEESFYQTTRGILESMHGGVVEALTNWKLPVEPPAAPLVALIFPNRESFDAFHKMPAEILAYYSIVNNFVVLYEDPELSDAAPELALKQAAYTIAHEGVHQILHNVGVQKRLSRWPAWLTEGLPEFFCPVKVTSSMAKEGSDSMPRRSIRWSRLGLVNDLRMYGLLKMKAESGEMIEKTVNSPALDSDGYAVAWGLVHYLMNTQPKQFQSYLKEIAALEPMAYLDPDSESAGRALFTKYWGADFKKLENNVARHLNSNNIKSDYRDPLVYQTHYVVFHTELRGKKARVTALVTTSPDGARKWRTEEEKGKDPGLKHGFRTVVCDTQQKAEAELAKISRSR